MSNEQTETQEVHDQPRFPAISSEAYISLNYRMVNPKGVEIAITMRESEAADADRKCFQRVKEFTERAASSGWLPVMGKSMGAPHSDPQGAQPSLSPSPSSTLTVRQIQPAGGQQQAITRLQPGNAAPIQQQTGPLVFEANILTVEWPPSGKKRGKMKGDKFTKFGVTLWPETAPILGFNLDDLNPGSYNIDPMMVAYCLNDKGQPDKIIGLA